MKLKAMVSLFAAMLLLSAVSASATTIADFTGVVTLSSQTQSGRLSRNAVAQTWTKQELYPGVLNTTTAYYYQTYTFASSLFTGGPYVEITEFSEANLGGTFVSAWANSYSLAAASQGNWLGDEGQSGNLFGNDASYFDVYLPPGSNLVLVLNNTAAAGAGLNDRIDLTVDSFANTSYADPLVGTAPSPTPEPSSIVLLGTGAIALAGAARRRWVRQA